MCVDADLSVVVILAIWAPDSLEMEHIEVHINVIQFDQFNGELALTVCERAVLLILARRAPRLQIGGTELCLVLIWVVEFFHPVVCFVASVALGTIEPLASNKGADLGLVRTKRSSPVLIIVMIEGAALQVVILWFLLARINLESVKIQE